MNKLLLVVGLVVMVFSSQSIAKTYKITCDDVEALYGGTLNIRVNLENNIFELTSNKTIIATINSIENNSIFSSYVQDGFHEFHYDLKYNTLTIEGPKTREVIKCNDSPALAIAIDNYGKEEAANEEKLLASVVVKRETCTNIGFESETEGMSNCILQLMLSENKKQQQVIISRGSSSAIDEQTAIMEQQLLLHGFEIKMKRMKTLDYMMRYGKFPPLGYGF